MSSSFQGYKAVASPLNPLLKHAQVVPLGRAGECWQSRGRTYYPAALALVSDSAAATKTLLHRSNSIGKDALDRSSSVGISLAIAGGVISTKASDGASTRRIKPYKSGTKAKWLIGNGYSVSTAMPCLSGGAVISPMLQTSRKLVDSQGAKTIRPLGHGTWAINVRAWPRSERGDHEDSGCVFSNYSVMGHCRKSLPHVCQNGHV